MTYKKGMTLQCVKDTGRTIKNGSFYKIEYAGKTGCTIDGLSYANSYVDEYFIVVKSEKKPVPEATEYEEEEEESRVIFDVPFKYDLSHIKLFTRDSQDTILLQTYDASDGAEGKYGIIVRDCGKPSRKISFEHEWSAYFNVKFPATKLTPDEVGLIREFADSLPEDAREEVLRVARVIKSKRKQKSALPNSSTESEETYGEREITFNVDDIKILGRNGKTENIILQVLNGTNGAGKTGIILRDNGKSAKEIDYRASWSSQFEDKLSISELNPNEIQLILDFAKSLTRECSEARDVILNLISKAKKEEKIVSCVLWAEPMVNEDGKHNTGDKAIVDIYKAFARTAYDKLGKGVLTSRRKSRTETVPIGEVVMITKSHFDNALLALENRYSRGEVKHIRDIILFGE